MLKQRHRANSRETASEPQSVGFLGKVTKILRHEGTKRFSKSSFGEILQRLHIVTDHSPFTTHYSPKKAAFTLAEVLITLTVIGVVAAITLPTVVNNIRDRQFRALWKKTFSEVSQAYTAAFGENAMYVPNTGDNRIKKPYSYEIYYEIFSRVSDNYCLFEDIHGHVCTHWGDLNQTANSLNGDAHPSYADGAGWAYLKNGAIIYAHGYLWQHPAFLVDVNGKNPPNVIGRDMFGILFRNNKVIPAGAPGYEFRGCDKNTQSTAAMHSNGWHTLSGSGCGYKYLYE